MDTNDIIYDEIQPTWKNAFENSTMVQFNHRYLAMFTFASIVALFIWSRRLPLNRSTQKWAHSLIGMSGVQVSLGISTLIMNVPISLAHIKLVL